MSPQDSSAGLHATKPHKKYPQLVNRLEQRGMIIPDKERAERKLSQIGYYRLSGYWYPCRVGKVDENGKYLRDAKGVPLRHNKLQEHVNFNDIIDLYLFDKKLRQLLLDAIERIEIHIRSVIAHELGHFEPLAYKHESFINPKILKDRPQKDGTIKNFWNDWTERQNKLIAESKEECILHHKKNGYEIPFWVVVETWDFGLMSKYFTNLNATYQNIICKRLDVPNKKVLSNWLDQLNILRNSCAHHKRVWNRPLNNAINVFKDDYFDNLELNDEARKRTYGLICILWFLVKKIGPSSTWIENVADLIDSKPDIDCCPYKSMGFPDNNGFPRDKFSIAHKPRCKLSFSSLLRFISLKK